MVLRRHLEPSLTMLEHIIERCPPDLWVATVEGVPFWQQVMHALTGVQFWFREPAEEFQPPDLGQGPVPDIGEEAGFVLTKEQVQAYLGQIQERVEGYFGQLDDPKLLKASSLYDRCTYTDIVLMQIRHIQYHVGNCNAILGDHGVEAVPWIGYGE